MVASIQRINPRSLRSLANITPALPAGPCRLKNKGRRKKPRPSFRITLTAAAGIAARRHLMAVVIHVPGHRPILAQIHPHTSARTSAQLIRELPFGWRASLHAVTVATEPPAKVKGDRSTASVFVRVSPNLDVWPDLAALVVSSDSHGPTIDLLSPAVNVKAGVRELNRYSDDATTRAVARPVVVLPIV